MSSVLDWIVEDDDIDLVLNPEDGVFLPRRINVNYESEHHGGKYGGR